LDEKRDVYCRGAPPGWSAPEHRKMVKIWQECAQKAHF
jgi:hypothetical protein